MTTISRPTEARFTALDLKSVADDGGFEGYASLFDTEDMGRDVILPGAFRDTLRERGAAGVRMLFQHDPAEPIGVWDTLVEDHKGLRAKGRLMPTVTRAREVLALMRAGAIDGLSIGFKPIKARRDPSSRTRKIEKVDLWEISIVTFPMLPGARVFAIPSSHVPSSNPSAPPIVRSRTGPDELSSDASHLARQIEHHAATPASPNVIAARLAGDRALASLMRIGLLDLKRSSIDPKANFNPGQIRDSLGRWAGGDVGSHHDRNSSQTQQISDRTGTPASSRSSGSERERFLR